MKAPKDRNYEKGDLVMWSGYVTGVDVMLRTYGVITRVDEQGYDIETPGVAVRLDGTYCIVSTSRRYGKALFSRLNPNIIKKHADSGTARLGAGS